MKIWVRNILILLVLSLLSGLLVFVFLRPVAKTDGHGYPMMEVVLDIRQTAIDISTYSTSGGRIRIAKTLDQIDESILPDEHRKYYDPVSGVGYDWLYFGPYIDAQSPNSSTILLAAPFTREMNISSGGTELRRVVAYMDSHAEVLSEAEFQKAIQAQIDEFRRRKGWK